MDYQVQLQYDARGQSDFVLNICPARTRSQRILHESLVVEGAAGSSTHTDPVTANRVNRLSTGGGRLTVRYHGIVELDHVIDDPDRVEERAICGMPSEVIPYILPSRYCPSDRMCPLALAMFGQMAPGYARVHAICQWVIQHVRFRPGASDAMTCAMDTFHSRAGVCRDYAHLMIAMCRALNIPARYVTGVDFGADPALGPPDFHAYVEVFLGRRWYLFDASGMTPVKGLIRIGTGRDAADVSFATVFGHVQCARPLVSIRQVPCGLPNEIVAVAIAPGRVEAVSTAADTGSLYFHLVQPPVLAARLPRPPTQGPWAVRDLPGYAQVSHFA